MCACVCVYIYTYREFILVLSAVRDYVPYRYVTVRPTRA